MTEQARNKVRHEAIPEWAEQLYYNKGLFDEALVYYDDEALYFELRGQNSGVLRFSYEMIGTLKEVVEELEQQAKSLEGATMPNGQRYEDDWLKSKGSGEDEENSSSL
jgi:hypothetical protein